MQRFAPIFRNMKWRGAIYLDDANQRLVWTQTLNFVLTLLRSQAQVLPQGIWKKSTWKKTSFWRPLYSLSRAWRKIILRQKRWTSVERLALKGNNSALDKKASSKGRSAKTTVKRNKNKKRGFVWGAFLRRASPLFFRAPEKRYVQRISIYIAEWRL